MAAEHGNKYYLLRGKHGRDRQFETPEEMWDAACEYFTDCDDNPILEEKLFHYQGNVVNGEVKKQRPYTLKGLCLFLGCNEAYFRNFEIHKDEKNKDFNAVIERIRDTIYTQKFEGAATDQFNANIIARDLGLVDKKEINQAPAIRFYDASKKEIE